MKSEAAELHTATLSLADSLAYRLEAASQDLLAAWNGFVADEKLFYGRSQAFLYFIDFADNSSRDEVLALESRFNDMKLQIGKLQADPAAGDTATSLDAEPVFSDPLTRQVHSVLAEKGGPVSEATGAVEKAVSGVVNTAKSLGWETIAGAVLVLGTIGLVLVGVARSGAVKVGV
ncbi:MAG TPA: hypothetical protein VK688_01025 [Gemmatimonadales bacterium]|nr:hypothetical protein [Gemmatimonadales bacterium]